MTITVHFGVKNPRNAPIITPEKVYKDVYDRLDSTGSKELMRYIGCPAAIDYYRNVFTVKSPLDYTINFDPTQQKCVTSDKYDQQTFNNLLNIRDEKLGFYSIRINLYVVPDKSVEIEAFHPLYGTGELSQKALVVPGKYNAYKHIRPLEIPVASKQPGKIYIKEGDDLIHIKFNTREKIIFKRFIVDQQMDELTDQQFFNRNHTSKKRNLLHYYNMSKEIGYNKMLRKLIKQNEV